MAEVSRTSLRSPSRPEVVLCSISLAVVRMLWDADMSSAEIRVIATARDPRSFIAT
jgi:hypothetical protein